MIGTGHIIPHRLRCVVPQKHGAGIANLPNIFKRLVDLKLKVLRSNPVGQFNGSIKIVYHQYGTKSFKRFPGNLFAG